MGDYNFGLGRGSVSKAEDARLSKIAERHGAWFISVRFPGDGPRYWFGAPNRGSPFDEQLARKVMAEVGAVRTMARRRG